jgi:hypothetical protein
MPRFKDPDAPTQRSERPRDAAEAYERFLQDRRLSAELPKIAAESTVEIKGSCHCENISVDVVLSRQPESISPRACDCDFCFKHGAAYVSDPAGSMAIRVRDPGLLGRYRQGSGTAECLFCKGCGVLVGVLYEEGEKRFAALNTPILSEAARFGGKVAVSPKKLGVGEKIERWKELWFSKVTLRT